MKSASHEENAITLCSSLSYRLPSNHKYVALSWFEILAIDIPFIVTVSYRMHRLLWSKHDSGCTSEFYITKKTLDCVPVIVQWHLTVLWKGTNCIVNIGTNACNHPNQQAWYSSWAGGSSTLEREDLMYGIYIEVEMGFALLMSKRSSTLSMYSVCDRSKVRSARLRAIPKPRNSFWSACRTHP